MPRPDPEIINRTYTEHYQAWNVSGTSYSSYDLPDFVREYNDYSQPGWPKSKPYNDFDMYSRKVFARPLFEVYRYYPGFPYWDHVWFVYRPSSDYHLPSGCPYLWDDVLPDYDLLDKAMRKCQDKILDQKVNLAQAFAERAQTVRLIEDTVLRLSRAMRAVRRLDFNGARVALGYSGGVRKTSGQLGKDWLSFQYGWKPLLSDVKGAAEHLAQSNYDRPGVIRARVKLKANRPLFHGTANLSTVNWPIEWSFSPVDDIASCILEYGVSNDLVRSNKRLGISDPLTLAWELVPYSFVVDWFLPIGDFLRRLNYDSGLYFHRGMYSVFARQEQFLVPVAGHIVQSDGQNNDIMSSDPFRQRVIRHVRRKITTSPSVKLPQFKDPFSPTHVLNALALMRVAFR